MAAADRPSLLVRLPALALSLGIAGFLVFQAGVPGCGPESASRSPAPPASESPAAGEAPASERPVAPAADAPAEATPAEPTPAEPSPAEPASDAGIVAGADAPTPPANGDAAPDPPPKPRFFPASKAMAPLIEPQAIAPEPAPKRSPQQQNARPQQQAPQPTQQALNPAPEP